MIFKDRPSPFARFDEATDQLVDSDLPLALRYFAGAGQAHMNEFGTKVEFVCDGDNTYGGQVVTNPSGGLLSKGHPLGATGLAQCFELTQQLRGTA